MAGFANYNIALFRDCPAAPRAPTRPASVGDGSALSSNVVDAYRRAPAPHDLTIAGFANLRLEHKFLGTEENVGGHELGSRIGHVEDLATHAAMTVVKDDERVF